MFLLLLVSSNASGILLRDTEVLGEETHRAGCVGNTAWNSDRQKIHAVYHANILTPSIEKKQNKTKNQKENGLSGENNKC